MEVQVTILVENTTPHPAFIGEYGLGMLVKVDGRGILFDAGMADGIARNMKALGISSDAIEMIALSHGHFDHAGGLPAVLDVIGPRDIYLHPYAIRPKFTVIGDNQVFIGMPQPEDLEKKGARLIYNEGPVNLVPGVTLCGTIPRTNDFEDTGGNFAVKYEDKMDVDTMADDQALFIDHPDGLIIVSGCAHAGMINTLEYGLKLTGASKVKAWIGGTHLTTAGEERMQKTIDALRGYDIDCIAVSHCTGFEAAARIYAQLGPRVLKGEVSSTYAF